MLVFVFALLCPALCLALDVFTIEGNVNIKSTRDKSWMSDVRILVEGGRYKGFIRKDGSFVVNGVPSGSYVIEVVHPVYQFLPARVDILPTGKMRARRVNYMQASKVSLLSYPLVFNEWKKSKFFEDRENMGPKELLQHPMVLQLLTMVLPVLLVMMLPKMMSAQSAEAQEQLQNQMNMMSPGRGMPTFDLSEWLTNYFNPQKSEAKRSDESKSKRKNRKRKLPAP